MALPMSLRHLLSPTSRMMRRVAVLDSCPVTMLVTRRFSLEELNAKPKDRERSQSVTSFYYQSAIDKAAAKVILNFLFTFKVFRTEISAVLTNLYFHNIECVRVHSTVLSRKNTHTAVVIVLMIFLFEHGFMFFLSVYYEIIVLCSLILNYK